MSHTMKLWERVMGSRIRKEVTIAKQQFGFMPVRNTTDAIFCLRMLMEKWSEGQKAVNCVFIDLKHYIHNTSQVSVSSILSSHEKTRNPANYPKYTTTYSAR